MAVVQISKIQIRRGKKNSVTGVPQLSSGELAWAVDTQELYIGNGSVAEGAPAVGNSKILTEHDNLLDFLETYRYGAPAFPSSVPRTIQSKLDDHVSILDFGPPSMRNGVIDCTQYFQTALSSLFGGEGIGQRRRLYIPIGQYKILGSIYIPSNAVIVGENSRESVIVLGTTDSSRPSVFFESSDGRRPGTFMSGGLLPTNISISNLTFNTTFGQIDINGLTNSKFEKVTFTGGYNALGAAIDYPAVTGTNTTFGIRATNNEFLNCKFEKVDVGIKLTQTEALETVFRIIDCEFNICGKGIWIVGIANQKNLWFITNSRFTEINDEAFNATQGMGTLITESIFTRCANGTNNDTIPSKAVVKFGQNVDNVVSDCSFSRTQTLMDVIDYTTFSIAEVDNGTVTFSDRLKKTIQLGNVLPLMVLSSGISFIEIEYVLKLSTTVRTGILNITVDKTNELVNIQDDYGYTVNPTRMEGFQITSQFLNNDADPLGDKETLMLYYTNPIANNAPGSIDFKLKYSV